MTDELQELIDSLGIDQKKVYRIYFSDGTEIITETLPFNSKSKKITAVNPVRIMREHYVDDGLLLGAEILLLFDPNMENPILEFNRDLILTYYKVDEDTLGRYVYALFDHYFPLDAQFSPEDPKTSKTSIKSIKTNVISFVDYKNKRSKGIF